MSTRTFIVLMILSAAAMVIGIGHYGWLITWIAELWHIKGPLIEIFLCGSAFGIGIFGFGISAFGAIQNTKSRIQKRLDREKIREVMREVKKQENAEAKLRAIK